MDPKRSLLSVASRVSAAQPLLATYDQVGGLREFPISDDVRTYALPESERRGYVYIPLLPGYASWGYIAGILGHAFRCRGYEPLLLLCEDEFTPCPATTVFESSRAVRERCVYYGRKTARTFGFDTYSLSDLVESDEVPTFDAEESVTFDGVDISTPAMSSSRKYLQKYHVDLAEAPDATVYRRLLATAARLVLASRRLLDAHDVAATLVYEPCYVHGDVPLSVARDAGVPARSVGMGFRNGTLIFGNKRNRAPLQQFTDHETLCRALDRPLTESERERVTTLMEERATGTGVPHHFTSTADESVSGAPTDGPVVGMFTNLLWDASLEPDTGAFGDVFDWIRTTLDHFAGRSDASLVLKTHPAEAARGTRESVEDWVREHYGDLPPNITLLPSDTDVNTYELFADLDAGVVFNSTVGLEMAFRGYPVVVGGDTHYRGVGATIDPDTPAEYEDLLADIGSLDCTDEMHDRAVRYAHFLLVRTHVDFPYYDADSETVDYEFLPFEHADVAPGTEPFDTVIESLVTDTPVIVGHGN